MEILGFGLILSVFGVFHILVVVDSRAKQEQMVLEEIEEFPFGPKD